MKQCKDKSCDLSVLTPANRLGLKKIKNKHHSIGLNVTTEPPSCLERSGLGASSYNMRVLLTAGQQKQDCKEDLQITPNSYEDLEGQYCKNVERAVGFTKGLIHDDKGEVVDLDNYKKLVCNLIAGDQVGLDTKVTYYKNAAGQDARLVDPWSGIATNQMGAANGVIPLDPPPCDFSSGHAADLVENYSMNLALDVPFEQYPINSVINNLILTDKAMNNHNVLNYGTGLPACKNPQTANNIFRGNYVGNELGPYISQLFLYNVNAGNLRYPQKYSSDPTLAELELLAPVTYTISNGFTVGQCASLLNSDTRERTEPTSPATPPASAGSTTKLKYITTGRDLSRWVRTDPTSQGQYQAALILGSLATPFNPTLPSFLHNSGNSTAQSNAVAEVSSVWYGNMARIHGYFWKWFMYRRARPEAGGLYTHLQLSGIKNYGFPSWYTSMNSLFSAVAADNKRYADVYPVASVPNLFYQPGVDKISYTLHQQNRAGAPNHPSYPAAHSYIAGAGFTFMKFIYDGKTALSDIPLLKATGTNTVSTNIFQAADIDWANSDPVVLNDPIYAIPRGDKIIIKKNIYGSTWTLNHEINKQAFNISIGRGWLGLHYRSDNIPALYAGEQEAIRMFQDQLGSWYQNKIIDGKPEVPEVSITTFNGDEVIITPTTCFLVKDGDRHHYKLDTRHHENCDRED